MSTKEPGSNPSPFPIDYSSDLLPNCRPLCHDRIFFFLSFFLNFVMYITTLRPKQLPPPLRDTHKHITPTKNFFAFAYTCLERKGQQKVTN